MLLLLSSLTQARRRFEMNAVRSDGSFGTHCTAADERYVVSNAVSVEEMASCGVVGAVEDEGE